MRTRRIAAFLRSHAGIGAVCAAVAAVTGWVATKVFLAYPICLDEYNYVYQAKIFASNQLWLTPPGSLEPMFERYMRWVDGRYFTKYGPLWPLVLSIGERVQAGALVNPVLSAVTIFFIYKTALLLASRRTALLSAVLVATTSYFIGYGASYFAQPFTLCVATAAFYVFRRYELEATLRRVVILGALPGLLCFSRPADAFCLAGALAAGLWWRPVARVERIRHLRTFAVVAAAGALGMCAYNWFLAGTFSPAAYPVDGSELHVIHHRRTIGDTITATVVNYFKALGQSAWPNFRLNFVPRVGWTFASLVALGLVKSKWSFRWVLVLYAVLTVALYNFHPGLGWPQYGARYWYPAIGALALVAALGVEEMTRALGRTAALGVVAGACAIQIHGAIVDLGVYAGRFNAVMTVKAALARECPRPAIVRLEFPFDKTFRLGMRTYVMLWDLKRNMFFEGPHKIALGQEGNALRWVYPDLPYCDFTYDPDTLGI